MIEKITKAIFDHMVELAALQLTPDEAEYLRKELNNQLQAVEELAAIPLDEAIDLAAHGVPYTAEISQGVREDRHRPFEDTVAILGGAPETEDDYFVVSDIPHEDLD